MPYHLCEAYHYTTFRCGSLKRYRVAGDQLCVGDQDDATEHDSSVYVSDTAQLMAMLTSGVFMMIGGAS